MKKYIRFEIIQERPKTNVYAVISKKWDDQLGEVRWFGPWRQYCLFPNPATVWNPGCLNDVNSFIANLMAERKK